MANPIKVKVFQYSETDALNEFIKSVDLPEGNSINFRDQGIILVYRDRRDHFGLTKEEHLQATKDEIARAEAELADALLSLGETNLGYKKFKGKSGMKKVEDSFLRQLALDRDTVDNKEAKVSVIRDLYVAIENDTIKVGEAAVAELFEFKATQDALNDTAGQDRVTGLSSGNFGDKQEDGSIPSNFMSGPSSEGDGHTNHE